MGFPFFWAATVFIDEAEIIVSAGSGGNGCWAYERAKYKPKGPPSGGTGGRGGHVIVRGNCQLHTLQDLAYRKRFEASRGAHGKGSNKDGKNGEDVIVDVPLGTMIFDAETDALIMDCIREGEEKVVARGGKGGRGNAALACRRNPNPQTVEEGKPGEEKRLRLVLKVLADVGLVGRPNAGKSTFLSRISRARPKIADYPFTTTTPNLGIVASRGGYGSFVVADIPGLIEGSHTGKGLGIRFLRHIERTRVLAILIESTSADPVADARVLRAELAAYDPLLAEKQAVYILTKSDLLPPGAAPKIPRGWLTMSAVTGEGVEKALRKLEEAVERVARCEEANVPEHACADFERRQPQRGG